MRLLRQQTSKQTAIRLCSWLLFQASSHLGSQLIHFSVLNTVCLAKLPRWQFLASAVLKQSLAISSASLSARNTRTNQNRMTTDWKTPPTQATTSNSLRQLRLQTTVLSDLSTVRMLEVEPTPAGMSLTNWPTPFPLICRFRLNGNKLSSEVRLIASILRAYCRVGAGCTEKVLLSREQAKGAEELQTLTFELRVNSWTVPQEGELLQLAGQLKLNTRVLQMLLALLDPPNSQYLFKGRQQSWASAHSLSLLIPPGRVEKWLQEQFSKPKETFEVVRLLVLYVPTEMLAVTSTLINPPQVTSLVRLKAAIKGALF